MIARVSEPVCTEDEHPGRQSGREADSEHDGIHEPREGTEVVFVYEVADSIDIRYTGNKIEDTCGEGDLRRVTPAEDGGAYTDGRGEEGAAEERESDVALGLGHYLFQSEPEQCGDEHDEHRPRITTEETAERGIGERGEQKHLPPRSLLSMGDEVHGLLSLVEVNLAVGERPTETAEARVHRKVDASVLDRRADERDGHPLAVLNGNFNVVGEDGHIGLDAERLGHAGDILVYADARSTAAP